MLGFVEAIKKVVKDNYCNFNGRARRSEYWWYMLAVQAITWILTLPLSINSINVMVEAIQLANQGASPDQIAELQQMSPMLNVFQAISSLISFALLLPSLGVTVRRLHDIGKSGWYYLFCLIPCVGIILLLVWLAQDSDKGANEYGESPKYPSEAI